MIRHPQQGASHRGVGLHVLQSPSGLALVRNPSAAHQLGLADIQRRDPLDDLLNLWIYLQHRRLLPSTPTTSGHPQGPQGVKRNLIRVLKATLKLPMRDPQHPAETRPPTITDSRRQRATTTIVAPAPPDR